MTDNCNLIDAQQVIKTKLREHIHERNQLKLFSIIVFLWILKTSTKIWKRNVVRGFYYALRYKKPSKSINWSTPKLEVEELTQTK